ncbi:MAG: hypothetical protein OHK0044_28770 [Burkholderiaceae bacterium]
MSDFVCLVTAVDLPCTAEAVFAFITNPARWSRWHPATVAVRGVTDRPLALGETVVETIGAAGRRFEATWTVRRCEPPRRWVIETASAEGEARIEYQLEPHAGSCRFTRLLWFRSRRAPWHWLDRSVTRRLLAWQSRRALDNLRRLLSAR